MHEPTSRPADSAQVASVGRPDVSGDARVLACVVCGDDSEFIAVASSEVEDELMCSRCGQARLVTRLPMVHARRLA